MRFEFSKVIKFIFFIIFLLIQLAVFYFIFYIANNPIIYIALEILTVVIGLIILSSNKKYYYKLSWIVFLVVFPITATLFYLLFGDLRFTKRLHKYENSIKDKYNLHNQQNDKIYDSIRPKELENHASSLYNHANFPVYNAKGLKYFPTGELFFEDVIKSLKEAKKYILIESYITAQGILYDSIKEILIQKAKEGLKVYLIYDSLGSIGRFNSKMKDELEENGIEVHPFNANIWNIYNFINYRSHRKMIIIDGEVAYTGGLNIGDEYVNLVEKYGIWKDMGVRFSGASVNTFIKIFAQTMLAYSARKNVEFNIDDFLNKSVEVNNINKESFVIPIADGPTTFFDVGEFNYMQIITNAKEYVYINTPYFIIDEEITIALKLAARSGVDVRVMIPGIPDKKIVYEITKAHLKELMFEGVKFYTYDPGFLHGKTIVSDNQVATVGSINFDYRSLLWNYECALFVYDKEFAISLKEDFNKTILEATLLTHDSIKILNNTLIDDIGRGILKVIGPLM